MTQLLHRFSSIVFPSTSQQDFRLQPCLLNKHKQSCAPTCCSRSAAAAAAAVISWEDVGSERITGETGIILRLLALGVYSLCFTNQTSEGLSPAADAQWDSSIVFRPRHFFSDSKQISVWCFRFLATGKRLKRRIILSDVWSVSVFMLFLAWVRWVAYSVICCSELHLALQLKILL